MAETTQRAFFTEGNDTVQSLAWFVFGCIGAEQPNARMDETLYVDMFDTAVASLAQGKDTPLAPPGLVEKWTKADTSDAEALSAVLDAWDAFPPMSKMNVVGNNIPAVVDVDGEDVEFFIPVVVETTKGISAIVPVVDKDCDQDIIGQNILNAHNAHQLHIADVRLWDFPRLRHNVYTPSSGK